MKKDDSIYIEHILDCLYKINKYTNGLSVGKFVKSEIVQDAVIRNFEIIGEAGKRIIQ